MAFDLSGAVQQARTGIIPPEWRCFPLQRRAVWTNILSGLILGVFSIGVAVYLFVTGTAYVPAFLPDSFFSPQGVFLTSVIESLLFLALGVWLLVTGIRWISRIGDSDGHFFLVTLEGFALVQGEKVVGVGFAEVAGMKQRNGYFGPELVVRKRAGGSVTLAIGRNYGPAREISMTLLEKMAARRAAQR